MFNKETLQVSEKPKRRTLTTGHTRAVTSKILNMKIDFILAFTLFFSITNILAAESSYECPPEITTTQAVKDKTPDGWSSLQDTNSKHWLDTVMVFDGPPEELASLVPDNSNNQDIKKTVWSFQKKKERPIWFTCSYLKTSVLFAKPLPLEITQCRVLLAKKNKANAVGLLCK
ncbi:MAG: hypothetical protein K2Q18_07655 [Bdellovibrionales bacterium]|nr:hypothetical protein [Bdellovibrionales bacterium]